MINNSLPTDNITLTVRKMTTVAANWFPRKYNSPDCANYLIEEKQKLINTVSVSKFIIVTARQTCMDSVMTKIHYTSFYKLAQANIPCVMSFPVFHYNHLLVVTNKLARQQVCIKSASAGSYGETCVILGIIEHDRALCLMLIRQRLSHISVTWIHTKPLAIQAYLNWDELIHVSLKQVNIQRTRILQAFRPADSVDVVMYCLKLGAPTNERHI